MKKNRKNHYNNLNINGLKKYTLFTRLVTFLYNRAYPCNYSAPHIIAVVLVRICNPHA